MAAAPRALTLHSLPTLCAAALLPQVRWIGAPLAYCLALSVAVGVYHNLADVRISLGTAQHAWLLRRRGGTALPTVWCCGLGRAAVCMQPPVDVPPLSCTALQAGIVPEVLPELKTQLPIQLTSAALSTLLVLR